MPQDGMPAQMANNMEQSGQEQQEMMMGQMGEETPEDNEVEDFNDIKALQQQLDSLTEQQKLFVSEHMTPEIVQVFGLVLGSDEIVQALSPYVDEGRILVPHDREEFMRQFAGGGAQQGQAPMPQGQAQQQQQSPMM